jgi:hypothetical protein
VKDQDLKDLLALLNEAEDCRPVREARQRLQAYRGERAAAGHLWDVVLSANPGGCRLLSPGGEDLSQISNSITVGTTFDTFPQVVMSMAFTGWAGRLLAEHVPLVISQESVPFLAEAYGMETCDTGSPDPVDACISWNNGATFNVVDRDTQDKIPFRELTVHLESDGEGNELLAVVDLCIVTFDAVEGDDRENLYQLVRERFGDMASRLLQTRGYDFLGVRP